MSINKNFKLPETDLYMDDKGNVVSLVELLGGKELAIESGHHTYKTPNTSMVIDSDGNLYNLVDVIKNAVDNRSQDQGGGSALVTTPIIDTTLTLTTDKYQSTVMEDNTTITLPSVESFTEIHLFFNAKSELTLALPNIKWQNQPNVESNKVHEFIFTYTTEWLGGCVVYA